MIPLLTAVAAPIVRDLMGNGLSILASAVANKGKAYVEEKLGVKLPEQMTPEQAVGLRQLEMEHEEALQAMAIEGRKLDLETLKAEYADLDSARRMGAALAESQYWLQGNIVPLLAVAVCVGGCLMLWFSPNSEVRMAAVSFVTMVLGYYFGSSKGSKDKQAMLDRTPRP